MARTKRQASVNAEFEENARPSHMAGAEGKKRKVEALGPVRAARDPANSSKTNVLQDTGLPTPEGSCLAEEEKESIGAFPFLKLPAELRLDIYHWALCSSQPLILDLAPKDGKDGENSENSDSELQPASHASTTAEVNVALLRTCSLIYKEARKVFYSHNNFTLSIESSVATLAQMHQRSRSLIKSVTLAIPSHHDILDSFADLVRLGLRYCWGLKTFTIRLDVMLPDFDSLPVGHHGGIYANAFRILRWLPKGCKVILEGNVNESVKRVVAEEGRLLVELDEASHPTHLLQKQMLTMETD